MSLLSTSPPPPRWPPSSPPPPASCTWTVHTFQSCEVVATSMSDQQRQQPRATADTSANNSIRGLARDQKRH